MKRPGVGTIVSILFLLYISHSLWTLYGLFHPDLCNKSKTDAKCLEPATLKDGKWPPVQVRVYVRSQESTKSSDLGTEIHRFRSLDILKPIEETVEFQVPAR